MKYSSLRIVFLLGENDTRALFLGSLSNLKRKNIKNYGRTNVFLIQAQFEWAASSSLKTYNLLSLIQSAKSSPLLTQSLNAILK